MSEAAGPAVGDVAPDFALTPLRFYDFELDEREITRRNAGELYAPVRLSDFRGKRAVALVFGSYRSALRAELPALEALWRAHADRVQFLVVYIREAPAAEARAPRDPQTPLERLRIANSFAEEVQLSIPCLVDGMDDATLHAYAAHPTRLYLVARDGRIAHAGAVRAGELQSALDALAEPGDAARAD